MNSVHWGGKCRNAISLLINIIVRVCCFVIYFFGKKIRSLLICPIDRSTEATIVIESYFERIQLIKKIINNYVSCPIRFAVSTMMNCATFKVLYCIIEVLSITFGRTPPFILNRRITSFVFVYEKFTYRYEQSEDTSVSALEQKTYENK